MPWELETSTGSRYAVPVTLHPAQRHVGGNPRVRFVRGYGSETWYTVQDGIREPATIDLIGVLHTDHDDSGTQSLLDALAVAADGCTKLVHVDHDGVDVEHLALLGSLPMTVVPTGVDGTLVQVTLPLVPGATEWVVATDSGDYDSGYEPSPDPEPSAYRYFRINVTANNGRSTLNIAEFELRASVGGPTIATGGTPSASTVFGSTWSADKGFDANASTFWSATGPTGWLQYDLGAGNEASLAQYAVRGRSDANDGSPKDWTFEGSLNGSDWTTLDTVTSETGWANGELRAFTL